MKHRNKFFLLGLLGLVTLSLTTAIPVAAFSSDSFSQGVGDILQWEVTYKAADYSLENMGQDYFEQQGDRCKVEITKANQTPENGYDTLYGNVYGNTATNRTWKLYEVSSQLVLYNSTHGMEMTLFSMYIIPHNETTLLYTYNETPLPDIHSLWIPGPNGYDGILTVWWGSGMGQLGFELFEVDYNAAGLAQTLNIYNGTGLGWQLGATIELLGGAIPGFSLLFVVFSLASFMGLLIFDRHRKIRQI